MIHVNITEHDDGIRNQRLAILEDDQLDTRKEIQIPVEYYSTASNILLGVIIVIYIPLILAPILLINFSLATASIMSGLLLALAFGIYALRGSHSIRSGVLSISPGDARIEHSGRSTFIISSAGLREFGQLMLRSTQASLFETRIIFQKPEDCAKARDLIKQYY